MLLIFGILRWWLHDPGWPGWNSVPFRRRDPGSVINSSITSAITCKKFRPDKMGSLFCTAGIPLCRDEIFPCNRFSPPNRKKKSIKISIELHFNTPKIFLSCFYDAYDVNLLEKKVLNVFVEFYHFTGAATEGALRNGVLKNGAIFAGKHLFWSLFAGLQVCNFINKRHQHVFMRKSQIFIEYHFEEHLRTTVSYFIKINNSSRKKTLNRWKSMQKQSSRGVL